MLWSVLWCFDCRFYNGMEDLFGCDGLFSGLARLWSSLGRDFMRTFMVFTVFIRWVMCARMAVTVAITGMAGCVAWLVTWFVVCVAAWSGAGSLLVTDCPSGVFVWSTSKKLSLALCWVGWGAFSRKTSSKKVYWTARPGYNFALTDPRPDGHFALVQLDTSLVYKLIIYIKYWLLNVINTCVNNISLMFIQMFI